MDTEKFQTTRTSEKFFSRFSKKSIAPIENQLQRWEDEGGCVPVTAPPPVDMKTDEASFTQRLGSYLSRAWKSLNANFNPLEKKNIQ